MKTLQSFREKPVEALTLIVLTLTGIVLGWYSVETHLLRKTTQEQLVRSYMPIVVIDFKKSDSKDYWDRFQPVVQNVGFGPAFNIEVSNFKIQNSTTEFRPIPGLGKDSTQELPLDVYTPGPGMNTPGLGTNDLKSFASFMMLRTGRSLSNQFPVTITYYDSHGTKYSITQEVKASVLYYSVGAFVTSWPSAGNP